MIFATPCTTLPHRTSRIPITHHHLSALRLHISASFLPHDALMLWAACTSAFFGLLRSSEYTSQTPHLHTHSTLLLRHVSIAPDYSRASLHLPFSKTDQFGRGATVYLTSLPSTLCPVSALIHYLAVRSPTPGPLFLFSDGSFLTRDRLTRVLSDTFPLHSEVRTHSFRIGGATALAAAGVPEYVIRIMGRWSSDSFLRYIHVNHQAIASLLSHMVPRDPR